MPYCFLGSSTKFQGHTGWKIDYLDPISVRLLGRSQLSNPTDLPCSVTRDHPYRNTLNSPLHGIYSVCYITFLYVLSLSFRAGSQFIGWCGVAPSHWYVPKNLSVMPTVVSDCVNAMEIPVTAIDMFSKNMMTTQHVYAFWIIGP